jgi:diguanylate cyclase (GGDEF)-like protein
VLVCDFDCFKEFNDRYGHPAGDDCLRRVAGALEQVAGRSTDLVARFGGEEFVVALPGTGEAGALRVAEQARALVAGLEIPHAHSTADEVVTASIGVATVVPGGDDGPAALLERADAALYEAKRAGRNRVVAAGDGDAGASGTPDMSAAG